GNPETTSGGNALKFYASVRLDIRRVQSIKAGNDVVGNRTLVKIKKNKVAPPFMECEFDIMYNEGISKSGDVLDLAINYGLVDKRGAYFRYGEAMLGQGRENAKTFLAENPALMAELENQIRQEAGLPPLALLENFIQTPA
ncbi:MAG: DNA recombination/repair protein RecA, partial [Chloroflexi bacterium]|nr:DNA recombination/repair protein RecA [Chloroflexota bacterium]MCI0579372.1 DNA recombination/repair protein RecA [Chloroflexota bacterium]MCI0646220.1 DNA recombination/repair protein RecA [Chloroflexota bacterium]MCI0726925.1 DNA recombination/repair protein RecA [Chloroflexota bacterium]